ncbi:hypothetical protein A2155_01565 [candidate division WWE3 bacterium RBG_16_52_45]|nr:MAG: hypothetical protein A2155_01565 [candidate division WWE3 bacterium RBG_16_52_45]
MEDKPEEKQPVKQPEAKKGGKSCLKIFLAAIAILFFLFLLLAGAVAAGIAATGLVEVPVLSKLIKPPAVTEDFSYKKVSEKKLSQKLESAMSGTEGNVKITITLTDDEMNTLISGMFSGPDSPAQDILVKFSPGVIKIKGELADGKAPFYAEIQLARSADSFVFEIQKARLGALPIPGFLVEGLIGQFIGTGQFLGKPTAESLPVKEITVKDGSITIKGLDLSGLGPPGE